ncbi:MAG: ethanolamine utilization protein EutH [Oscillospiraceae bacterium]|nr:ethanolamine utilization protein EutH [Oscillospiraceae bacterium]
MVISKVIMIIMAVFFTLGALDRLFMNKFGMGSEFERAWGLMGPTALSILGMLVLAPTLAGWLQRALTPVFSLIHADAAMLVGSLLSCEISTPLAEAMTDNIQIAHYSGLIVGTVMGFIISFTIPVACGLIKKEDYRPFGTGILAAYICDPVACFIGGLLMGLPFLTALLNIIPVVIIAVIIVLGLLFAPEGTIRVFRWFARILLAIITIGLIAAAIQAMTGFVIIPNLEPISDGFKTVGTIVLSLAGSLPLLFVLQKILHRPLEKLGKKLGVNDVTMLNMVVGLTSLVPGYSNFCNMNSRGKVIFAAFSASAGCMFGCHLAVTSSFGPDVVVPMLIAKVCAGVFAICMASYFYRRIFGSAAEETAAETETPEA